MMMMIMIMMVHSSRYVIAADNVSHRQSAHAQPQAQLTPPVFTNVIS